MDDFCARAFAEGERYRIECGDDLLEVAHRIGLLVHFQERLEEGQWVYTGKPEGSALGVSARGDYSEALILACGLHVARFRGAGAEFGGVRTVLPEGPLLERGEAFAAGFMHRSRLLEAERSTEPLVFARP
ncbi:MAG: hypothetical protein AB7F65_02875 [Dehalococcoidia bacterium]